MKDRSVAQALIAGPITDVGQLTLAWVINELAGPDGWAVHTRKDLAKATRTSCQKASKKRIETMIKMGYLEARKKPIPGLRLTDKALAAWWVSDLSERVSDPSEWVSDLSAQDGSQTYQDGSQTHSGGSQTHAPNASAYLPKRYKDKEEDKDPSPSSSPGVELMLVADNQAEPISTAPNQPAAQPPAIVDQGAQLPVPAKPKKKARAKPKTPIPADFYPSEKTIAAVIALGFTPDEALEELPAFKLHWEESGKTGNTWGSAYLNWYKRKLKWRIEDEQNAKQRERYTDASGRRISESTRVMQDISDSVAAHADFFASLDPDKPI